VTPIIRHGALASLAAEWDALADRLGADPFLRPGWVQAWLDGFGGGALELLTVRGEDGRLEGVLPLVRRPAVVRVPANVHTPRFDVLAQDTATARALLGAALEPRPLVLSLGPVDAASRSAAIVAELERSRVLARPLPPAPFVVVDGDFDAYLAARRRSFRADLRRRRRRLAEEGAVALTTDGRATGLDELMALEALGWKGERRTAIAARAPTRRFYAAMAAWAAGRGVLQVFVLRLDGRPLAALVGLEEAGVLHLLKGGLDPAAGRFSPGALVLQGAIEHAFGAGLRRVELGGGTERYKLEWAEGVRERVALTVFAPGRAGGVARAVVARARPLAERARLERVLRPARDRVLAVFDSPRRGHRAWRG
jgi:CelD/BcsL family acetyltransferase involved in cellulose biosynthesis